jgi:hypothetical protein
MGKYSYWALGSPSSARNSRYRRWLACHLQILMWTSLSVFQRSQEPADSFGLNSLFFPTILPHPKS